VKSNLSEDIEWSSDVSGRAAIFAAKDNIAIEAIDPADIGFR